MRKTVFLLPCLAFLLLGCANTPAKDSSSENLASTSEDEGSRDKSKDKEKLEALGQKLRSYEGQIKSRTTSLRRTFVYPGDGYFGIDVISSDSATRYKRGDSYLIDSEGSELYDPEDSEDNEALAYHSQIYDDGKKIYSIKEYEDGTERSQKSLAYAEASAAEAYDIGFAKDEIANFDGIFVYQEVYEDLFDYTFSNIDGKENGGKLSYSYSISIYGEDEDEEESSLERYLTKRISYKNEYTISSGLITHLSQDYLYEIFAGEACQSVEAKSEIDYSRGEYEEYEGELLATTAKDTN